MDVIIAGRTIAAALIVGIGVTFFSALSPARRAATVPPVAAMRAGFRFGSGEGTRRTIIAAVLAALGVIGCAVVFAEPIERVVPKDVALDPSQRCTTAWSDEEHQLTLGNTSEEALDERSAEKSGRPGDRDALTRESVGDVGHPTFLASASTSW